MNKEVIAFIKKHTKEFDTSDQRAELLTRNEFFLKELGEIKTSAGVRGTLPYRKYFQKKRGESRVNVTKITPKGLESPAHRFQWPEQLKKQGRLRASVEMSLGIWSIFCRRWNIMPEWDGELRSLGDYMEPPLEFFWVEGSEEISPALIMRINEWTTLNDIKGVWGQVEELQNELWRKQEKRTNFARDLLWYDLSRKYGLKYVEIAKLWNEYHPEDIDLLIMRRMKEKIKKEDLQGKALTDSELLKEIRTGFLADKYRSDFEAERNDYVSDGEAGRKVTPPFLDAVKKAIKRMSLQISQANITSQQTALRLDLMLSTGRQMIRR
jgi:hypothetical protein